MNHSEDENGRGMDPKKLEALADLYLEKLSRGCDVYFSVLSGGMRPLITPYDKIRVRKVSSDQIVAGDIVVFKRTDGQFTVHRILSKRNENGRVIYTAKADARQNIDPPIEEEQIIGKVIAVKKRGIVLRLDNRLGLVLIRVFYFYASFDFALHCFLSRHPRIRKVLRKAKSVWVRNGAMQSSPGGNPGGRNFPENFR
ncbi:MAG: S24 family peptidase [Candidatus Omnitrophica bacterium]|nr:S24 family peptidase [Candidatus Omnitrophota bacterium]MDD5670797.1 S24 family peptidase [Candidatus Omnitrophota bacterium]